MSRTWNTRIEQNIHFPLKSYSPWSLVSSTIGLTQNFHRTVLLCWEGWDISLILFPLSCETHRQFDYNLSNNWWFVIFNCFKIMFKMSHYQWLHMVRNLEYVWKISFRISAGAKRDHESPFIRVTIRTTVWMQARWRSCERKIQKVRTVPLKYF